MSVLVAVAEETTSKPMPSMRLSRVPCVGEVVEMRGGTPWAVTRVIHFQQEAEGIGHSAGIYVAAAPSTPTGDGPQ